MQLIMIIILYFVLRNQEGPTTPDPLYMLIIVRLMHPLELYSLKGLFIGISFHYGVR